MTNFKGISKIRKDKANEIKLETDLVNIYKNAITIHFNNVISEKNNTGTSLEDINIFFYMSTITNYSNYLTEKVKSDSDLCTIKELEVFNKITTNLLIDIVQFFMGIKNYDSLNDEVIEGIRLSKINIDEGFNKLGQFDKKIQDSSITMKNYCLRVINESIDFLCNSTHIYIKKCPFKFDFENLQYNLENSTCEVSIKSDSELKISINKHEKKNLQNNLSLKQIGLKYAYENNHITKKNCDEIAKKYNHNSGIKLLQHFTFFLNRNNRKAKPHPSFTRKTVTNKIKLFESVIEILSEEFKEKANDELKIIKTFLIELE